MFLDTKGDCFIKKDETQSHEGLWRSLLILLARYRSYRPINGIVLCIPATELYGVDKKKPNDLQERASYIAAKLRTTQKQLGIRIPIYVIVTKLDIIPGFQNFCAEIPSRYRYNMLGWSNPYTPSTLYSTNWVDEVFLSIGKYLHKIRMEIFAERQSSATRDGIFVFPKEFSNLKENLGIYLNTLFKDDVYNEPVVFRGVYFCGNSGMTFLQTFDKGVSTDNFVVIGDLDNHKPENSSSSNTLPVVQHERRDKYIFFINDVLLEKVCREQGFVVPLKAQLLNANFALNVAKVASIGFVLVGSYGLFRSYDRFSHSRDKIIPLLYNMDALLKNTQHSQSFNALKSPELFDQYTNQFTHLARYIQERHFFSYFIPASWFSPLHNDLKETLSFTYQQTVLRSIYIHLLLKARMLLNLKPPIEHKSKTLNQLFNPLETVEFLIVKQYVDELMYLQEKICRFNNLKTTHDSADLSDLSQYALRIKLPNSFLEQYQKCQRFFKHTSMPTIDLQPYKAIARETLSALYQNFLNVLANAKHKDSITNKFDSFLKSLLQKEIKLLPKRKELHDFYQEIADSLSILGEKGKTWMDKEYFNPSTEWDIFFDKVDGFSLFGKDVSQFLVNETGIAFNNLKQQFLEMNKLFEPLIPKLNEEKKDELSPSGVIFKISKLLETLLSETYMHLIKDPLTIVQPPAGKIVYWDDDLIQAAYDMCQQFEKFNLKQIPQFPTVLQENIKHLTRQYLQENIVNSIAKAQTFADMPFSNSLSNDVLYAKISDIRGVTPKFVKLLEILKQDPLNFSFVELRSLLNSTSYWLLEQIDTRLSNLGLYNVIDFDFNWWDGKEGAAIEAYARKDLKDLESFLALQYKRVKSLAVDFARPIVEFLMTPIMMSSDKEQTLILKWKRIIEQCESQEQKSPNSSVQVLENFIKGDLYYGDSDKILEKISLEDVKVKTGDFFLEIVRQLKKGIRKRAEIIKRQRNVENYTTLVSFFNEYLKDKFPFADPYMNPNVVEATPENIKGFFRLYNKFGGSAKNILDQIYQLGFEFESCFRFLISMDKMKKFFEHYLDHESPYNFPIFNFHIDFRENREYEEGANLIVDLTMKPHDNFTIHKNDQVRNGVWVYGNPIEMTFRWPDSNTIPDYPVNDPEQQFLIVDGRTVTFRYQGRWALLWLLYHHRVKKDRFFSLKTPNSYLLRFKIPTNSKKKAVIYHLITLMLPSSEPDIPGKVVEFP
ncbi:MAG: type VI secretion system protein [Alphaproteobacteria bacterium]